MKLFKYLTFSTLLALLASCANDDNTYTRNNTREPVATIPGGSGPLYGEGDDTNGGLPEIEEGVFVGEETIGAVINGNIHGTPVAHDIEPVYFAFDSAAVRSAEDEKIQAIAEFLTENETFTLVIGGHCDERGSDEYNRSLSEKRALSVKESLFSISPDLEIRIETVAYGEEKPAVIGADSQSYAKNRRAEFEVYEAN
ncbi:OmpA family protein [Lentisphaera profundi]|uniref:OmpA family protein n=1 Tax=Lentisphaera profundi TaxID=1658616 RepID=A0ABY7VUC7_9BACT|nr:OmpA family protein [Lentisphaera profundi]WDE97821.1 OmpA family protein [Lentisphaera profundi]